MATGGPRVSALAVYRSALQPRRGHKRRAAQKEAALGAPIAPQSVRGEEEQPEPGSAPGAVNGEQPRDPHDPASGKQTGGTGALLEVEEKRSKKQRVSLKSKRGAPLGTRKASKQRKGERDGTGGPQGPPGVIQTVSSEYPPPLGRLLGSLADVQHSRQRAAQLFGWLIAPVSLQDFFDQYWEKKPLLIHRGNPNYHKGLFSTAELDAILRNDDVQFGVNLDVTSYSEGQRETHNPAGRALPAVVWDFYKHGCSLRMLNPQAFSSTVWQFLSILQEQFGSMVGANTYLTPPGTQGFAPHYDDIEAFVIQLEGKKHWRVYSPRTAAEVLPQFSSHNFNQMEIGEPILETVLEAGDLLYFPRGFIHQGDCLPDAHSLHITVSSYQRHSWGDLLEKLLPAALQAAIEEDVEYRQGLPMDYWEYMGVLNSDHVDARRATFMRKINSLITKLSDYAPVDAAVDQKAKAFLHDCLPPVLTKSEKALSVYGHPAHWENGSIQNVDVQIQGTTQVRLLRYGIVRLCNEGDSLLLYYTTENSRVYHKEEPKYCEIEPEYADGIEFLLSSYPKFVSVKAFPCATLEDKIALATALFEKGLLITKKSLSSL